MVQALKKRQRPASKTAALIRVSQHILRRPTLHIKIALLTNTTEQPRCIVVTPRIVGNAVQRNKLKRQIRALFAALELFQTKTHWIFFCSKNSTALSFTELKELIEQAKERFIKRTNLLSHDANNHASTKSSSQHTQEIE